ncbi:MAG: penicillin-binding protein 1C [Leeuwenhoekiella sp.]
MKPIIKKKYGLLILAAVFGLLWLFSLPKTLFEVPLSTVVNSREGQLLGARIADDGQWRFPEMDGVPRRFEQCILQFEDAHFYSHPGFNPVSMGKALWQNLTTDSRGGGSTLTQQVIRLSRRTKWKAGQTQSRTYFEKLVELVQATRLELKFSKEEILNLYTSHAPFGGNVVGLETASWRYFGIPAQSLSWGQAASLAVLPNAPSLIFPGRNEIPFKQKRDRLLKKLFDEKIIDSSTFALAIEEPLPGKPLALPDYTPHFTEKIRQENPQRPLHSTIDYNLQRQMNRIVANHCQQLQSNQIHNIAVLVLDVETREVLGYVGNSPTTRENQNFVDVMHSPRSTGSVLKPFLYASMLEAGELLPDQLVADVPTVVNGYAPTNFDGEYSGAVAASAALSKSLNVPAVRLLSDFGLQRFYNKLQKMGMAHIDQSARHYGLPLILGGAESSLWEITKTYANLAGTLNYFNTHSSSYRSDEFGDLVYDFNDEKNFGKEQFEASVFEAGAIFKTFEALQEVNRPDGEENWSFFDDSQPIAWKTGTSFGFKDAWAVGVTPKYAIGVWVGNADGEGRPGLTGVQAAAPILFEVLKELPPSGWFAPPYDAMQEVAVCAQTGFLRGAHCPEEEIWVPEKGVRAKSCPFHQSVFLNTSETLRVNASCYDLDEMVSKKWFALPPVMEYYYAKQHPEYRPLPPFDLSCFRESEPVMQFIIPKKGEAVVLPKGFDSKLNEVILKLGHRNPDEKVFWYLDQTYLGQTGTFHEIALQPKPGTYLLTAVDGAGNRISQQLTFALASG